MEDLEQRTPRDNCDYANLLVDEDDEVLLHVAEYYKIILIKACSHGTSNAQQMRIEFALFAFTCNTIR